MNDLEQLSRMLEGELSPHEEEALRARMEQEPELARAWETMKALPMELAALPEMEPPVVFKRRRRWGPWLLAAAMALFAAWPSAPDQVTVGWGAQLIEGDVSVTAGEVHVAVDGSALISVEPAFEVVRESAQKEDRMNKSALLGVAAGAIVTVTVYEGRALVTDGGDARTVEAGDSLTVNEPVVSPQTEGDPEDPEVAQLRRQVQALEAALAEVGDVRVVTDDGGGSVEPVPWPEDTLDDFQEDAFRDVLRSALSGRPDIDMVEVDCSEYPCLAVVESFGEEGIWEDEIEDLGGELTDLYVDRGHDVGLGVWNHVTRRDGDDAPLQLSGLLVAPPDMTPEQQSRVASRMRVLLDDIAGEPELKALGYIE